MLNLNQWHIFCEVVQIWKNKKNLIYSPDSRWKDDSRRKKERCLDFNKFTIENKGKQYIWTFRNKGAGSPPKMVTKTIWRQKALLFARNNKRIVVS